MFCFVKGFSLNPIENITWRIKVSSDCSIKIFLKIRIKSCCPVSSAFSYNLASYKMHKVHNLIVTLILPSYDLNEIHQVFVCFVCSF